MNKHDVSRFLFKKKSLFSIKKSRMTKKIPRILRILLNNITLLQKR